MNDLPNLFARTPKCPTIDRIEAEKEAKLEARRARFCHAWDVVSSHDFELGDLSSQLFLSVATLRSYVICESTPSEATTAFVEDLASQLDPDFEPRFEMTARQRLKQLREAEEAEAAVPKAAKPSWRKTPESAEQDRNFVIRALATLLDRGYTVGGIRELTEISEASIRSYLRSSTVPTPLRRIVKRYAAAVPELPATFAMNVQLNDRTIRCKQLVAELEAVGMTLDAIAKEIGVKTSTLRVYISNSPVCGSAERIEALQKLRDSKVFEPEPVLRKAAKKPVETLDPDEAAFRAATDAAKSLRKFEEATETPQKAVEPPAPTTPEVTTDPEPEEADPEPFEAMLGGSKLRESDPIEPELTFEVPIGGYHGAYFFPGVIDSFGERKNLLECSRYRLQEDGFDDLDLSSLFFDKGDICFLVIPESLWEDPPWGDFEAPDWNLKMHRLGTLMRAVPKVTLSLQIANYENSN